MSRARGPEPIKRAGMALTVAMVLAAAPAPAQQVSGRFAVQVLGFKVGDLALNGSVSGGRYTVSAEFVTSGLVAAVAGVHFMMHATGDVRNGRFSPRRYSEDVDTGQRQSRVDLRWSGGVARASGSEIGSRGRYAVTAAQQKGAVDPLTAMFMAVRDQAPAEVCRMNQRMFDGERLTEVVLNERSESGGQVICRGVYRRVAGYSPADLRKRSRFPLTVTYAPAGEAMRAVRVEAQTIFGKARLVRK